MIVDPVDCSAADHRRFDTWLSDEQAHDLVAYFNVIRTGVLLVGVTGDEPVRNIEPARRRLRAAGIRIDDVQSRGSFAFVIQFGYPEKTMLTKSINNQQLNTQLRVAVNGE